MGKDGPEDAAPGAGAHFSECETMVQYALSARTPEEGKGTPKNPKVREGETQEPQSKGRKDTATPRFRLVLTDAAELPLGGLGTAAVLPMGRPRWGLIA